jgi:membrane protein
VGEVLRGFRARGPGALTASEAGRALVDGFAENALLTYASAVSFQVLTAIIPFVLFVLALADMLHLDSAWRDHLAPQIQDHVSPAVFRAIAEAVDKAFAGRQTFWATFGGALALWQVSGAVRAVMEAFARIYGSHVKRSFIRRYSLSLVLGLAVGACFILATLCSQLAPFVSAPHEQAAWSVLVFAAQWLLAGAFLLLAVALLVRFAPATRQPLPWVSVGAAIVIGSWVIVSLAFRFYLTTLASYGTVFGSLASVIVAMAYIYVSTIAFLFGAQVDAILRAEVTGARSG